LFDIILNTYFEENDGKNRKLGTRAFLNNKYLVFKALETDGHFIDILLLSTWCHLMPQ